MGKGGRNLTIYLFYAFLQKYGEDGWEQWWDEWNKEWDEERLRCDEELDPSDDEPGEGTSQSSYSTPPKRPRGPPPPEDIPSSLSTLVSHAVFGNKTYNCFIIYTTETKMNDMRAHMDKKFSSLYWCTSVCADGAILYMIFPGKHRVTALQNWGRKICAQSFIFVRAVLKKNEMYKALGQPPFTRKDASRPEGLHDYDFEEGDKKGKDVDWPKLCEFAHALGSTDPLLIMGMYLEFAGPPSKCQKCNSQTGGKVHWKNHSPHHENAKIFSLCKTQKNICAQAADQVAALQRVKVLTSTRKELLCGYFEEAFEKMAETCGGPVEIATTLAGVAWLMELIPDASEQVVDILKMLVENTPKKRYVHFIGPINSGKTTLAAGIMALVKGVTLNVNVPPEKLPFELGCAQDKFAVLFEDVKGHGGDGLPSGCGFTNLDNMRDHLDGAVPVNLERKHVNKVAQLWPPGIITSNQYVVPKTVAARVCKTIKFKTKNCLQQCLQKDADLVTKRVLQSPVTLLALLVWNEPVSAFMAKVQEQVVHWKTVFEAWISFGTFMGMRFNITEGKPPLEGVCVYDDDDGEDEGEETATTGPTQNTTDTGFSSEGFI